MTQEPAQPTAPTELVDRVADVVLGISGVHDLHGGVMGEVATYLPGRRVAGIRLLDPGCEVHLVLARDAVVSTTASQVRSAVLPLTGGPVHVHVEDVAAEAAEATAVPTAPTAPTPLALESTEPGTSGP